MDHFPSFFFFLNPDKKKSSQQNKIECAQQKVEKPTSSSVRSRHLSSSILPPFVNTESVDAPVVNTEYNNKRVVFLNLHCFYQYWRFIPSNVISDCILILPNIYTEWISNPKKNINGRQIPNDTEYILSDYVFLKLLQWKHQQGLLFCMLDYNNLNDIKSKTHPFWHHLNRSLCKLSDPSTTNSHYNPLILDRAHYIGFESKYRVTAKQIANELETLGTKSCSVVAEILFQSNPSLNIVTSHVELTQNVLNIEIKCVINETELKLDEEPSRSIGSALIDTPDEEINELLDNIFEMYPVSAQSEDVIAATPTRETLIDEEGWWFSDDYEAHCNQQDDETYNFSD